MHRIDYSQLTERQIGDALARVSGPDSASPLSDALAGRSLTIVTDGGPRLAYSFAGTDRLSVSENAAAAAAAGYGALLLAEGVTIFSHLIPGTQRGYNVVLDEESGLATVFEVWFSGFEALYGDQPWFEPGRDNREVQRHVWFGYVEQSGRPAPQARHARTNRIEGKGYFWRQDNGTETLEFYPSVTYSHFVELSRTGGELGFCAPADYVKINDHLYVYSRTECEFSGVFTIYVLDTRTAAQAGARLGFNEKDELEYYLFRGEGELLGQLARFEPFHDYDGATPPSDRKGDRAVYRPLRTYDRLESKAAVDRAVAQQPLQLFEPRDMAGNQQPPTGALAGKTFTLRWDDGRAVEYRFDSDAELAWRNEGDGGWTTEAYQAWESSPQVFLFAHLLTGAPDHDCQVVVADLEHGLATLLHGAIGNAYIANEARVRRVFGVVETQGLTPPRYRRHYVTDEMLGRALTWEYSPGLTSMHLYATPHSLSWIIPLQNGAMGLEWSGASDYVKIRDGLYLTYWIEEACNGTLGCILINLNTMHDCGVSYHCGSDGLRLGAVGAFCRHAGKFDIAKYFQIET